MFLNYEAVGPLVSYHSKETLLFAIHPYMATLINVAFSEESKVGSE